MKKTIRPRVLAPDTDLLPGMHPVLARLYALRGVRGPADLEHALKALLPAQILKGLETALELLEQGIRQQQRILVVGDFDADGATSTALAVLALRAMGAQHVDYLVPNRFEHGYGLTPEIVRLAAERKPDFIITVDNGIASMAGVVEANKLGISVLVTDHHLP